MKEVNTLSKTVISFQLISKAFRPEEEHFYPFHAIHSEDQWLQVTLYECRLFLFA
jgi:hypothetical protein